MLKFFRRIRKRLMSEGRIVPYLTYALGEIALVVVGILIALAINNAQVRHNLKQKERLYLASLQNDFQINHLKLQELIRVNRRNYEAAIRLLDIMEQEGTGPDETGLSRLIFESFAYGVRYNPNVSVLSEMISSGSLKDLTDRELRFDLTNWLANTESVAVQEGSVANESARIYDLFRESDGLSLRTVFDLSGNAPNLLGVPTRESHLSNMELLESMQFQNSVLLFITLSRSLETVFYQPLLAHTDKILKEIEAGLEDSVSNGP